jgi:hypothetical protein
MATSPNYPSDVKGIATTIVSSSSTNWVTLYDNSSGSAAARCEALNLCSDDTSTINIQVGLEVSGSQFLVGTARAVSSSGVDGESRLVNALNIVGNVAPDAIKVVYIPTGTKLVARASASISSGRTATLTGWVRTY